MGCGNSKTTKTKDTQKKNKNAEDSEEDEDEEEEEEEEINNEKANKENKETKATRNTQEEGKAESQKGEKEIKSRTNTQNMGSKSNSIRTNNPKSEKAKPIIEEDKENIEEEITLPGQVDSPKAEKNFKKDWDDSKHNTFYAQHEKQGPNKYDYDYDSQDAKGDKHPHDRGLVNKYTSFNPPNPAVKDAGFLSRGSSESLDAPSPHRLKDSEVSKKQEKEHQRAEDYKTKGAKPYNFEISNGPDKDNLSSISSGCSNKQKAVDSIIIMENADNQSNISSVQSLYSKLKQDYEYHLNLKRKNNTNQKFIVMFLRTPTLEINGKLFEYFVPKNENVEKLKTEIYEDFGFGLNDQRLFYRGKEINGKQMLKSLKHYNHSTELIYFVCMEAASPPPEYIFKEAIEDFNIGEYIKRDRSSMYAHRNWTSECQEQLLLSESEKDIVEEIIKKYPGVDPRYKFEGTGEVSEKMKECISQEKELEKLWREFERMGVKSVELIEGGKVQARSMYHLYGGYSNKWIVGGMIVRRGSEMSVWGEEVEEMGTWRKVASRYVKNMQYIQRVVAGLGGIKSKLFVPMCCLVDCYGERYIVESLSPIGTDTLVLGTFTNGINIQSGEHDEEVRSVGRVLGEALNIAPHWVNSITSRGRGETLETGQLLPDTQVELFLPLSMQLHQYEGLYYLTATERLWPSLIPDSDTLVQAAAATLRPELVNTHTEGELLPMYRPVTSISPQICSECNEYIDEYTYYLFEKRGVDRKQSLLKRYICCITCYRELIPTNGLQVPSNKLKQISIPERERQLLWINVNTKEISEEKPVKLFPINGDAFCRETAERGEEEGDREELMKVIHVKKEEVLEEIVDDLNDFKEDIDSIADLEALMHSKGLNYRDLGRLALQINYNHLKQLAVMAILARAIVSLINAQLFDLKSSEQEEDIGEYNERDNIHDSVDKSVDKSNSTYKSKSKSKRESMESEQYIGCVRQVLNELFRNSERHTSKSLWEKLTGEMKGKYEVTIEREALPRFHFPQFIEHIRSLLSLHIPLLYSLLDNMEEGYENNELFPKHSILHLLPHVKHTRDISKLVSVLRERALNLDMKGRRSEWFHRGGVERGLASDIYRELVHVAESIYTKTSVQYAAQTKEVADQLESRHMESGQIHNSRWNKCKHIMEDEFSSGARVYFTECIRVLQLLREGNGGIPTPMEAECHTALARLYKEDDDEVHVSFDKGIDIIYNNIKEKRVFKYLSLGVEQYERSLGFDHPSTAEAYTKLALCYQEYGLNHLASPWIRRAFCGFYKALGENDQITINSYEYLKIIETNTDSKLDLINISELPDVILKLEHEGNEDVEEEEDKLQIENNPPIFSSSQSNLQIPTNS